MWACTTCLESLRHSTSYVELDLAAYKHIKILFVESFRKQTTQPNASNKGVE